MRRLPLLRIWYPHPQPPPPSRGRGLWGGGCAPAARQGGIASLAPFEPPSSRGGVLLPPLGQSVRLGAPPLPHSGGGALGRGLRPRRPPRGHRFACPLCPPSRRGDVLLPPLGQSVRLGAASLARAGISQLSSSPKSLLPLAQQRKLRFPKPDRDVWSSGLARTSPTRVTARLPCHSPDAGNGTVAVLPCCRACNSLRLVL